MELGVQVTWKSHLLWLTSCRLLVNGSRDDERAGRMKCDLTGNPAGAQQPVAEPSPVIYIGYCKGGEIDSQTQLQSDLYCFGCEST